MTNIADKSVETASTLQGAALFMEETQLPMTFQQGTARMGIDIYGMTDATETVRLLGVLLSITDLQPQLFQKSILKTVRTLHGRSMDTDLVKTETQSLETDAATLVK